MPSSKAHLDQLRSLMGSVDSASSKAAAAPKQDSFFSVARVAVLPESRPPRTAEEFCQYILLKFGHLPDGQDTRMAIDCETKAFIRARPEEAQNLDLSEVMPQVKKRAIIIDLDGTLCNMDHRRHYIEREVGKKDWDSFNRELVNDKPNDWCLRLIKAMQFTHQIIFVTGRKGTDENELNTTEWLYNHLPGDLRFHLIMREVGDGRPDYEVKKEIYEVNIKNYFHVDFVIEDRSSVVNMWRSIGLPCLQCDVGSF